MGRGSSGRTIASARLSRSAGSSIVAHPTVTDIDAYGEYTLPHQDRVNWLRDTLGTSDIQAQKDEAAIYNYTGGGYHDVHENINTASNDVIDAVIDNPNSPIYTATQFRGLKFYGSNGMTGRQQLESVINSGIWREPGATSFSAKQSVAESFAGWHGSGSYVSTMVVYQNPTTGMPIKHLSRFDNEAEVLHSRKQMTNGYKITGSQWLGNNKVIIYVADR